MRIGTEIRIESAHRLDKVYSSKCERIHGHSWRICIEIETLPTVEHLKNGMLVDFGLIKDDIKELDHQLLNDFITQPTCENLALHFRKIVEHLVYEEYSAMVIPIKVKVRVYETEHNWAEC